MVFQVEIEKTGTMRIFLIQSVRNSQMSLRQRTVQLMFKKKKTFYVKVPARVDRRQLDYCTQE